MEQARLGRLDVARIGFGAMGMSAHYTGAREDDEQSIRTIHRTIDRGVTLIVSAEVYGQCALS
jgi:aryl-alcohol dehydrogenase-like predicted oxidoreductase